MLRALAGVATVIGILRLIWPEVSRLVRDIWRDVTAAVIAVRTFKRTINR